METLGEALPKLMTQVRDEILPCYIEIGPAGAIGAAMIRHSLDAAQKAMMEQDLPKMIAAYEDLKEIKV